MVFWVPLHSSKVYIEAEPSVPVEVTWFWNTLCRCNRLRVKLSGSSLNQCPYKKRQIPCGHRDTGECHVMTETDIGVRQLWAKECQGVMANIRSWEEAKNSPLQVSKGTSPCWHLGFSPLISRTVRPHMAVVSLQFVVLFSGSPRELKQVDLYPSDSVEMFPRIPFPMYFKLVDHTQCCGPGFSRWKGSRSHFVLSTLRRSAETTL